MDAVDPVAALLGDEAVDEHLHLVDHRLVDFRRHRVPAVAFGQRDHADRQRGPGADLRQRRTAPGRRRTARAARSPTNRRRCRTGSHPRPADRPAGVQPVAASVASVSRSMISSSRPTSSAMRVRNSLPLAAARHASVAIRRARVTPRLRILSRQMPSASTARSIAGSQMRPVAEMPSPSRMMRENASMTRKLSPVGRAIRRRQLLVPRSSAA